MSCVALIDWFPIALDATSRALAILKVNSFRSCNRSDRLGRYAPENAQMP